MAKPLNVVYSGGTAFNFPNDQPDPGISNYQTYIDSQYHLARQATETRATILLSNHSEFDNAVDKIRIMPAAVTGRIRSRSAPRWSKTTSG